MQTLYWLPYVIITVLNLLLAVYITGHKTARGALSLIIIVASNAMWCLTEALIQMSFPLNIRMYLTSIQYIFIVAVPTFFIIFVMEYLGISRSFRKNRYPYLALFPLLTIISVWTNPMHHLFYTQYMLVSSHGREILSLSYGPLFMIWAAYAYLIILVATVVMIRAYFSASALYKKQYGTILLGVLVPWISNALYIFELLPVKHMDFTPLAYTITVVCFLWAFYSKKLFDLQPIARSEVFKNMSDGVLILDDQDRVADFNPAACRILDFLSMEHIGEKFRDLCDFPLAERILDIPSVHPFHLKKDGQICFYDIRTSWLSDRRKRTIGRILSFRDITEQKQMEAQLEYYATTDSLTGILNRRHFNHLAEMELHRCIRYNTPLSLCMIDIDHFKKVNDNFGHDTGDRIMKELVRICQKNLREIDLFARWGGEEFVVLLPETALEQAAEAAERLRAAIESSMTRTGSGVIKITISIGVTELDSSSSSLEEGLKHADIAMYNAKRSGRNRCCLMDNEGELRKIRRKIGNKK
ncbi:MAG: diguanylate cyclase [Spirochaetales bacterium]|nr:diguanylate cyclase [Spirochaetales bacterium]